MRIIHVEDFIQPEAGYQVNVLSKLQVQQGHEVFIVTSELDKSPDYLSSFFGRENIKERDEIFYQRTGARIIRLPLLTVISGRAIYYPGIFKTVEKLKPDIIFVHGEDTMVGMQFIVRSLWQKYPMILDCHMLELASENRFRGIFRWCFRNFITPIILKNKIPLIRVVDSDYVEKHYGIPLSYTKLITFGSDTDLFSQNEKIKQKKRQEMGLSSDDFVVVYAGKLDAYKGGKFLSQSIKSKFQKIKGKTIKFLIIGTALGDYGSDVEKELELSENEIIRYPTQPYYDLPALYQSADLAIFPRQCSLSFFDVQACGLPVLFEENEINNQRAVYKSAKTFIPEDSNDFRRNIEEFAGMKEEEFNSFRDNAIKNVKQNFDYLPIAQRFTDVLATEVEVFRKRRKK